MRLIANKRMYYGSLSLSAGDEFDALDVHARLLLLARAAAEVQPAEEQASEEEEEAPKPKRRYKRRDMQADE